MKLRACVKRNDPTKLFLFHQWAQATDFTDDGECQVIETFAILENMAGGISSVPYHMIRFLDTEEYMDKSALAAHANMLLDEDKEEDDA